ncbi:c-type cytochrome [Pseudooctadecabacter sp.]|uniref:c-type cytochrome n=1 Tax=Pseudooctadecabacter sp. TaxID=1966338 RepID=UPI0035C84D77
MNKVVVSGIVGALVIGGAAAFWMLGDDMAVEGAIVASADIDLVAGEAIYAQSCAACHGANLEGQADWRSPGPDGRMPAPPHDETGHTWHHSDEVLFAYTKLGGVEMMAQRGMEFDSGMPGFEGQLTDQEIWNVLAYIKSTWPEDIRARQAQNNQ